MLPTNLKPELFASYPPLARKVVTQHLATLRQLPLSFLPNLLREIVEYDFKFPAERRALDRELSYLDSLSLQALELWFKEFRNISLSADLESFDWVNSPAQFVEKLSAHLWTTHQLDGFRIAATRYGDRLHAAIPPDQPPVPRIGIAVIGKAVDGYERSLFRKLRPHGALFTKVKPEGGLRALLDFAATRAKSHPVAYGHWYIDGGEPVEHDPVLTSVSYSVLEPVRIALLQKITKETQQPGMGPEALRTSLAQMSPVDVNLRTEDAVLDRFQLKVLTEGSGTQIFSTTFAQWAAREALRRAQPLTLLVRFAPRQRQRPMNEMLSPASAAVELDPVGSLIDGEMGAYYNWLNQQRLPGYEQAAFLAWFENHSLAVAISPTMARATESSASATLQQVLSWML
jgi:hypothetical protein